MMAMKWKDLLQRNYNKLLIEIDTKNGLEGALRERGTFIPRVIKSIWDCDDTTKRVTKLLDQLLCRTEHDFDSFSAALKACGQKHIIDKYLTPYVDGQDATDFDEISVSVTASGDHSLLSQECSRKLAKEWNGLVERITSDAGLLCLLTTKNVFTPIQIQKLKDLECECERNEVMLRYLEKSSQQNFVQFCCSLETNRQGHLAGLIRPTGLQEPVIRQPLSTETEQAAAQHLAQSAANQHTAQSGDSAAVHFPAQETSEPGRPLDVPDGGTIEDPSSHSKSEGAISPERLAATLKNLQVDLRVDEEEKSSLLRESQMPNPSTSQPSTKTSLDSGVSSCNSGSAAC